MTVWIWLRIAGNLAGSSEFSTSIKKGVWEAQITGWLEGTGRERAVKMEEVGR
jgi:hypothetical protein